mmetsp:Transcript_38095/g.74915  ORF Transcript_38095/g.74915 Transcript_38095/m.74915 type:complete len:256 (+) Transcript_38095:819-1586(+)
MKRVAILERPSFSPLFDLVVDWKGDQQQPEAVASLAKFLFTFAENLEGTKGTVRRAVFSEPDEKSSIEEKPKSGLYSGFRGAATKRKNVASRKVLMFAAAGDQCVTIVFVDSAGEKLGCSLCQRIHEQFIVMYATQLQALVPQFKQEAVNPDQALQTTSFLPHFRDFKDKIHDLITPGADTQAAGVAQALQHTPQSAKAVSSQGSDTDTRAADSGIAMSMVPLADTSATGAPQTSRHAVAARSGHSNYQQLKDEE